MSFFVFFFFFNDTATTEIYTLSLHDALPIWNVLAPLAKGDEPDGKYVEPVIEILAEAAALDHFLDRKSTRLNSSHPSISYAVFCLKKKKQTKNHNLHTHNKQTEHVAAARSAP